MNQELANLTAEELVTKLNHPGSGYKEYLSEATDLQVKLVPHFFNILAKASDLGATADLGMLIYQLCQAKVFQSSVAKYIREIQKNSLAHQDYDKSLRDMVKVFRRIQETYPSYLEELDEPIEALDCAVRAFRRRPTDFALDVDSLTEEVANLMKERDHIFETQRKGNEPSIHPKPKSRKVEVPPNPPDNFRDYPEFPTEAEIQGTHQPYLRPNVIKGRFNDADHYLDIQYRLLREDFICPLREGLKEYRRQLINPLHKRRIDDIKIYTGVHVLDSICTQNGLNHILQFDISKFHKVNWEFSKRLIYGALLCLSKDDFQTFIFAAVQNRDPKKLKSEGKIEVKFAGGVRAASSLDLNTEYLMVETDAYFEAYRYVLKRLQTMDHVPFGEHIVECNPSIDPPRYLEVYGDEFDFKPVIEPTPARPVMVPMLKRSGLWQLQSSWPSALSMNLDESQLHAIQHAMTKRFSLIQGPPGTGKTFIGLKIVRLLLHNRAKWDPSKDNSILIVTFTNHALDQFLEGILDFLDEGIIRIGGRSDSERLSTFNLKTLRDNRRKDRSVPVSIHSLRVKYAQEMKSLAADIEKIYKSVDRSENVILSVDDLLSCMEARHSDSLLEMTEDEPTSRHIISEWLGLFSSTFTEMDPVREFMETGDPATTIDNGEDDDIPLDILTDAAFLERERADEDYERFGNEHEVAYMEEADEQEEGEWMVNISKRKLKQRTRSLLKGTTIMTSDQVRRVGDLWQLPLSDRPKLYRFWVQQYRKQIVSRIHTLEERYDELGSMMQKVLVDENVSILQAHDYSVVGMTTTGMAKNSSLLKEFRSKIVIIEEAAEVLEAHLLTALVDSCEHVILIGDHEQLRPNPTVYKLVTDYNIDVSLFERMLKNNIAFSTLKLQHRMRPEISYPLRHIYDGLKDSDSVRTYEHILGVTKDVFFLNHNIPESADNELSHENKHEAEMTIALVKYLVQQGYNQSQITVLTAYRGQLFLIKKLMKRFNTEELKAHFAGIRVTVVDNFQGEENDIIVLSLVRSNKEKRLGFLKKSNRVCVALSRAKKGLFVLGNFDMFASESELWEKIVNDMKKKQLFGDKLVLACQIHQGNLTEVGFASDFQHVSEGGCREICKGRLQCGHSCEKVCHPYNRDHSDVAKFPCRKPCARVCENGHPCQLKCNQPCKCMTLMRKRLPCGHIKEIPCSAKGQHVQCRERCNEVVVGCPLDHRCKQMCGAPCDRVCREVIPRQIPKCRHTIQAECGRSLEEVKCSNPCAENLACGHQCSGSCGGCSRGRLHASCTFKCQRVLVCGHTCNGNCTERCPPCQQPCENSCAHSRCEKKCGEPCAPCKERCSWSCQHKRCRKLCSSSCNRTPCEHPCHLQVTCENCNKTNVCVGLCGEPCPPKCRACIVDELGTVFLGNEDEPDARFVLLPDCGHCFEQSDLETWMNQVPDANPDTGAVEIALKLCPFCKTGVRSCQRFKDVVNACRANVEDVKSKIIETETTTDNARLVKQAKLHVKKFVKELQPDLIVDFVRPADLAAKNSHLNPNDRRRVQLQHQHASVPDIGLRTWEVCRSGHLVEATQWEVNNSCPECNGRVKLITRNQMDTRCRILQSILQSLEAATTCEAECENLFKFILSKKIYLSGQQSQDIDLELKRLLLFRRLVQLPPGLRTRSSTAGRDSLLAKFQEGTRLTDQDLESIEEQVDKLGLPFFEEVTAEERQAVSNAIRETVGAGHWFRCPNGHSYIITECGGANQQSRCPECGRGIGGTSHQLLSGNVHDHEMDRGEGPAFDPDNYARNEGIARRLQEEWNRDPLF